MLLLHLRGMKRTDTWKPLGSLTTQIAGRLMERRQAELKKDGSPGPKAETAAKYPPGRSARPQVEGAAIGNDRAIALAAGEKVAVAPVAGRTRATAVRHGQGGDGPVAKANVIDYRERPVLLAVWGLRGVLPRHRAVPNSYARTTSSAVRSKAKAKSSSDAPNRTATTPK